MSCSVPWMWNGSSCHDVIMARSRFPHVRCASSTNFLDRDLTVSLLFARIIFLNKQLISAGMRPWRHHYAADVFPASGTIWRARGQAHWIRLLRTCLESWTTSGPVHPVATGWGSPSLGSQGYCIRPMTSWRHVHGYGGYCWKFVVSRSPHIMIIKSYRACKIQ